MAVSKKGNQSHLTLTDRIYIEQGLERQLFFNQIATFLQKDPSTISKEIRRHRVEKVNGHNSALCVLRNTCTKKHMCHTRYCNKLCGKCTLRNCHNNCPDYQAPVCQRLQKAPYVCNGCGMRSCRQNRKYYYRAQIANQQYRELLTSFREGINKTPLELDDMDRIVSPLIMRGQPLNHIFASHGAALGCSRRTIYHYIDKGAFAARNIDLPRKVRYKPRKKNVSRAVPIPAYRSERTYKDFEKYMAASPDTAVVEMDTVEGIHGGAVLLTMLFRSCNFMMIFLLERQTQECVCQVFNAIEAQLGTDGMLHTFPVILTDNGAEFKNPVLLEKNLSGQRRTRLFYCDPMASWQKGRLEKNHEFIRVIIPKGRSMDALTPGKVSRMMNHINSTARAGLNDRTPFELAELLLPLPLMQLIAAKHITHDAVLLKPSLLK